MRREGVNEQSGTESAIAEHPRSIELRTFVELEYRAVVGSVTLITGDRAIAEDAVQEALVTAWRKRDEPIQRLGAWVTVVASNNARSAGRRRAAEQRSLDRVGAVGDGSSEPLVFDPELAQALRGLPLRERQAAVLFYVTDLSVADVAEQLGVTDGTVKTLLSRARGHLADQLQTSSSGGVA